MLTRLRLTNFRAWKDSGELRLAPLTVFFGANSAGKSSISQLLRLLRDTVASSERQRALQLGDPLDPAGVPGFEELVHGRDVSRELGFGLGWTLERPLDVHDPLSDRDFHGDAMRFDARLGADRKGQPQTRGFRYALDQGRSEQLSVSFEQRPSSAGSRAAKGFALGSAQFPLAPNPGRQRALPAPQRFYGFPDEVSAWYRNTAFTDDLVLELERLLRSVVSLGPLREPPRRLYVGTGETPRHVGHRGEKTIEALLAAGRRSFRLRAGQKPKTLQELVAERLLAMGLIHDFAVEAVSRSGRVYEVWVRTAKGLPRVKLTEVGFGVSQVLPVIVECFYVPRRTLALIEQPELHLHPRVQSDVADLFVDAVRAQENGVPRDCQFLVESHSEHFLRRLQRLIAEERLRPEQAALYFVETVRGQARVRELEVDAFGNILNWPEGFFGDEMGDLLARSEAQARRMERERPR